jgi:nucleoid DNA-binding protein
MGPGSTSPTTTTLSTSGWRVVWRKKVAKGDVIVVCYADDLVVGFQHRTDAERFLKEFRERLATFGLELHPDKTRLIEFGRFAARDRKARGEGKPETFTFVRICAGVVSRRRESVMLYER